MLSARNDLLPDNVRQAREREGEGEEVQAQVVRVRGEKE